MNYVLSLLSIVIQTRPSGHDLQFFLINKIFILWDRMQILKNTEDHLYKYKYTFMQLYK